MPPPFFWRNPAHRERVGGEMARKRPRGPSQWEERALPDQLPQGSADSTASPGGRATPSQQELSRDAGGPAPLGRGPGSGADGRCAGLTFDWGKCLHESGLALVLASRTSSSRTASETSLSARTLWGEPPDENLLCQISWRVRGGFTGATGGAVVGSFYSDVSHFCCHGTKSVTPRRTNNHATPL